MDLNIYVEDNFFTVNWLKYIFISICGLHFDFKPVSYMVSLDGYKHTVETSFLDPQYKMS